MKLERIPAALVAPCDECGVPVRRVGLRVFDERDLCEHCFKAMLTAAGELMNTMVLQLNEPDRICSKCEAMTNSSVFSSWCSVLELGESRAALCDSFTPQSERSTATLPVLPAIGHVEIWSLVCAELETALGPAHLDWLARTAPTALEGRVLVVEVPDEYTRSWLVGRLLPAIIQAIETVGYPQLSVEFRLSSTGAVPPAPKRRRQADHGDEDRPTQPVLQFAPIAPAPVEVKRPTPAGFNPAYSFEQFVVGTGNRLAHAGSLSVAEGNSSYNPLFLHGEVGVGKSHLLQAIAGRCRQNGRTALYVASETFTNELIMAIRSGGTSDFRSRYRDIDVLLVDDIHFIIGKESTQEEFFHTFNWLYDNGKQIVLSSDRAPNRMNVLDARLRSRFWWGLTADIQPPDFETRVEILRRKAGLRGRILPDDVLQSLASSPTGNIREVEGLLNRLLALADLHQVEPSAALTQTLFQGRRSERKASASSIVDAVAAYFRLSASDLTGTSRRRDVSAVRQVAMYLLRMDGCQSLGQVGEQLGNRDHSTVVYGIRRVESGLRNDESDLKRDVEAIRDLLR